MAEKEKGIVKKSFKSLFNVPRWVSWNDIVANGRFVISLAKDLFVKKEAKHYKDFDEAVAQLGISEEELQKRQKAFFHTMMLYFSIALVLLLYSLFLLFNAHLLSGAISLLLTILLFAYAYRDGIGYLQIKQRKLGITFSEWLRALFNIKVK